jgi:hypothetical protein
MSDCQFCTVETDCSYPYKPTDCVAQRKFRLKDITMPTDEQINKDLYEKVMKKCWHEFSNNPEKKCLRCLLFYPWHTANPDYLNSWNDYGELVKECMKGQEWHGGLDGFFHLLHEKYIHSIEREHQVEYARYSATLMLDPRKGSMAIWEFFCNSHT